MVKEKITPDLLEELILLLQEPTALRKNKNTKYGFVHGCDGCCSRIKIQES